MRETAHTQSSLYYICSLTIHNTCVRAGDNASRNIMIGALKGAISNVPESWMSKVCVDI